MLKIWLSILISTILYANNFKLDVVSFHNDKPYQVYSDDIVFVNDGIKFDMQSSIDKDIKIYYKFNAKNKLLKSVALKANNSVTYPKNDDVLKFDEEGVMTFIFVDNSTVLKEFIVNYISNKIPITNITNFKKTESVEINNINIEINSTKYSLNPKNIISNQRGAKDTKVYRNLISKTVLIKTNNGNIGAGIVISKDGEILTNWHVIKNNSYVNIAFKPKSKYKTTPSKNSFLKAKVIRINIEKDLAMLKTMDKDVIKNLEPIKLAILDSLEIGNDVYTIGHPLNQLFTLDSGMISQIRDNYIWETNEKHKVNFIIQTKNSISSGNSGGALVNENLELVGINTFSNTKGQNLNYAVSIYDIKEFLNNIQSDSLHTKTGNNKITYKILNKKEGHNTSGTPISTYFMDSNDNQIVDLVTIDVGRNGIYNYFLFDNDEDGSYDKKAYDKDGDGIVERTLVY